MPDMFLDPQRPLTTCTAANCEGCPVSKDVHCHFRARDLTAFLLAGLPIFFIGGAGIFRVNAWWLAPWLVMSFGYFGFIESRVMCSHCPHYAEPGKSLQCWANYGSPRLWKYRPGPMTAWIRNPQTILLLAMHELRLPAQQRRRNSPRGLLQP